MTCASEVAHSRTKEVITQWVSFLRAPITEKLSRAQFIRQMEELHLTFAHHELTYERLRKLFVALSEVIKDIEQRWWSSLGKAEMLFRRTALVKSFQPALILCLDARSFNRFISELAEPERQAFIEIAVSHFFQVASDRPEKPLSGVFDYIIELSESQKKIFVEQVFANFRKSCSSGADFCRCQAYLPPELYVHLFIQIVHDTQYFDWILRQDPNFIETACKTSFELLQFVLSNEGIGERLPHPQCEALVRMIALPHHLKEDNEEMLPYKYLAKPFKACLPEPRFQHFTPYLTYLQENKTRGLTGTLADYKSEDTLWLEAYRVVGTKSTSNSYQQVSEDGTTKAKRHQEILRKHKLGERVDPRNNRTYWLR